MRDWTGGLIEPATDIAEKRARDNGSLPPYVWVDSEPAWRELIAKLAREPRIALDLEANSLHAYRECVCLVQVSIPGGDYIVDPLASLDMAPLGALLADEGIEKVFHASDYDMMLLKSDWDFEVANLFDTMWAGRILGYDKMGLAWFLENFYGVKVSKRHQKANWGKRPLPEAFLAYAQKDTHYLLDLRDRLGRELEERGMADEAREIFKNACRITLPDRDFDPDRFWTLRGARDLSAQEQAVLRALYIFRDGEARHRNTPLFKVLSNEALVTLAKAKPRNRTELLRVKGISRKLVDRMGDHLVEIIEEGLGAPAPKQPRRKRKQYNSGASDRYKALAEWRKQAAIERGVESDVIMTRETMWDIAEKHPKNEADLEAIETLGPCRRELYAQQILEHLD